MNINLNSNFGNFSAAPSDYAEQQRESNENAGNFSDLLTAYCVATPQLLPQQTALVVSDKSSFNSAGSNDPSLSKAVNGNEFLTPEILSTEKTQVPTKIEQTQELAESESEISAQVAKAPLVKTPPIQTPPIFELPHGELPPIKTPPIFELPPIKVPHEELPINVPRGELSPIKASPIRMPPVRVLPIKVPHEQLPPDGTPTTPPIFQIDEKPLQTKKIPWTINNSFPPDKNQKAVNISQQSFALGVDDQKISDSSFDILPANLNFEFNTKEISSKLNITQELAESESEISAQVAKAPLVKTPPIQTPPIFELPHGELPPIKTPPIFELPPIKVPHEELPINVPRGELSPIKASPIRMPPVRVLPIKVPHEQLPPDGTPTTPPIFQIDEKPLQTKKIPWTINNSFPPDKITPNANQASKENKLLFEITHDYITLGDHDQQITETNSNLLNDSKSFFQNKNANGAAATILETITDFTKADANFKFDNDATEFYSKPANLIQTSMAKISPLITFKNSLNKTSPQQTTISVLLQSENELEVENQQLLDTAARSTTLQANLETSEEKVITKISSDVFKYKVNSPNTFELNESNDKLSENNSQTNFSKPELIKTEETNNPKIEIKNDENGNFENVIVEKNLIHSHENLPLAKALPAFPEKVEPKALFKQINQTVVDLSNKVVQLREPQLIKLRLRPAELGTIEIKLEQTESGKINARLITQIESTQHILSETVPQLRHSLEQAGFKVENLEITHNPMLAADSGGSNFNQSQPHNNTPQERSEAFNRSLSSQRDTEISTPSETTAGHNHRLLNLQA